MQEIESEVDRRRAIALAVALTAGTALAPDPYEWELLERYAQGTIALPEVLRLLDNRVHHLLFRSQARSPFTSAELTTLGQRASSCNKANGITGLLCYSSDGHFLHILEGSATQVQTLFANIQQDRRHTHVLALSDSTSPYRWFEDWQMALREMEPNNYHWLLGYFEAKALCLVESQLPHESPQLAALLAQFCRF